MPILLQINTVINSGSTGHIAEELGMLAMQNGWESYIAYGRNPRQSSSKAIKIGSKLGIYFHVFLSRFFDRHGFGSYFATKKLIKQIKEIKPDVIHLHNVHGYYLNIRLLFEYLKTVDTQIVWTLHDCWSFTGHCSHYTAVGCDKWQTICYKCPQKTQYPKSFFDNSKRNYKDKKKLFCGIKNLTIVTPSEWLAEEVKKSFLKGYPVKVINNGIDLNVFKPAVLERKFIILGVASTWTERKGFDDFIKLADMLHADEEIVLVGLSEKQIESLPKDKNIRGIRRTESQQQLAELYSQSLCFVNPTYEDTFPTTNIEALACGTPVITYKTGGSPEIIDEETGVVVEQGDLNAIRDNIDNLKQIQKETISSKCRKRAGLLFEKNKRFSEYMNLYKELITTK